MQQTNQQKQTSPESFTQEQKELALRFVDIMVFKIRPYCKIYESNIMGHSYEAVKVMIEFMNIQNDTCYEQDMITDYDYDTIKKFNQLLRDQLEVYKNLNSF